MGLFLPSRSLHLDLKTTIRYSSFQLYAQYDSPDNNSLHDRDQTA